jgi:hypothetical protein
VPEVLVGFNGIAGSPSVPAAVHVSAVIEILENLQGCAWSDPDLRGNVVHAGVRVCCHR